MKILDRTFLSPSLDLSCDEALLDERESAGGDEVLRFWSPKEHFVVLGYSNAVDQEVKKGARIPVYRRCSGGGTVLQGPGCLNYSLLLRIRPGSPTENVRSTNSFIMERHRSALEKLLKRPVRVQGHTDLTLGELKFSGNSQRRRRRWLLFHGTFLLDFDLSLIDNWLKVPEQQPAYRKNRTHTAFVTNLGIPEESVKEVLKDCWRAERDLVSVPQVSIEMLARDRYSDKEWNFRR